MSWLRFAIPFGLAFLEGFKRECNAPSHEESSAHAATASGFTIVDSGSALGWEWVAVPKAQARAFKAAHPGFYKIIHFLKTMDELRCKQPADYRTLYPLVMQVCDTVEAYDDSCELFIRRQR